MKLLTIPVITRTQDNGDGGYTTFAYNNENELIADHPNSLRWDGKQKKEVKVELSQDARDAILNEEDPYENGYIGSDTIEIEFNEETGEARLAKPFSTHAGQ
jgi:hypothetical protein